MNNFKTIAISIKCNRLLYLFEEKTMVSHRKIVNCQKKQYATERKVH